MFYEFPRIETLSDVLPAIAGAAEFIVADRGDHTVVNYVVCTPDTFPPVATAGGSAKMRAEATRNKAIRRECRGMIFDNATGKIIRRAYHKFFNLNQIAETQIDKIDLTKGHDIIEKLDGSMIVPYRVNGRVIWGTKMGDTDVCTPVEAFVKKNPQYLEFFQLAEKDNLSLIFEWMSRVNRIVIDHPEDRLVLTAARDINTGEYMNFEEMTLSAICNGIPVVDRFHVGENTSIDTIMEYIRAQEGTEGVVIRFDNGHMIKIKSEWYSAIHGAKELITEEKNVVSLILDEKMDDIKALVLQEDRDNLDRYERQFWEKIQQFVVDLECNVYTRIKGYRDRKTYALEQSNNDDDYLRVATFYFFDQPDNLEGDVLKFVTDRFIRQNLGTRTKFAAMKQKVFPNQRLYL